MYFMRFKQLLNLKAYTERNCTFFLWNADLIKYSFNLFRLSNLHSSRRFKDTYYLKYYSLVLKFHQSFKKSLWNNTINSFWYFNWMTFDLWTFLDKMMTFIIILPANIHALSDLLIFPSLSDKLPWQVLIHSSLFGHDLVSINDVCTIPISNILFSCKESNKI